MGHPQIPTSAPHLYSQAVQLKLYQAFIFSIPILFSIILFLLFYLFYLKRRSYTSSSTSPSLPVTTSNQQTLPSQSCDMGVKGSLKDKLFLVEFDEELKMKDSQCCVCLGEFEIQEELNQIPSCGHVFHIDCISHWLHSNSTCPLCRGSVIHTSNSKETHPGPPAGPEPVTQPDHDLQITTPPHDQEEQLVRVDSNLATCSREQYVIQIEGSSSSSTQEVFR